MSTLIFIREGEKGNSGTPAPHSSPLLLAKLTLSAPSLAGARGEDRWAWALELAEEVSEAGGTWGAQGRKGQLAWCLHAVPGGRRGACALRGPAARRSGARLRKGAVQGCGASEALLSSDLASHLCLQASACLLGGMSRYPPTQAAGEEEEGGRRGGGGGGGRPGAGGASEARGGAQAGLGPQQAATINTTKFSRSQAILCLALNIPLSPCLSPLCPPTLPVPATR